MHLSIKPTMKQPVAKTRVSSFFSTFMIFSTTFFLARCFCITLQKRKPRRLQRTGALCVQHSPTAAALSTSFLLNHAPNSPELNALITRFRESYSSVSVSREAKRLKKSSSWLNSGNALIHHLREKCNFRVSPFYQVVQKHKLIDVV